GRALADCLPHLEAVRHAVETYVMQLRDKANRPADAQQGKQRRGSSGTGQVSVTISIGVAERLPTQRHPEEVIKAADQALYSAKSAGRNCVRAHGQNRRGAARAAAQPIADT